MKCEVASGRVLLVSAWVGAALVAGACVSAQGEVVLMDLGITQGPGKNEFLVTAYGPGWSDDDVAIPQGSFQLLLTMDFDPITQLPTSVSNIQGLSAAWAINDLLFTGTVVPPSGPTELWAVPATGIGGTVMAPAVIPVTGGTFGGTFPAAGIGVDISAGGYEAWQQIGTDPPQIVSSQDFQAQPYTMDLTSGSGTVAVSLTSFDGVIATYDVTATLPVDFRGLGRGERVFHSQDRTTSDPGALHVVHLVAPCSSRYHPRMATATQALVARSQPNFTSPAG